MIINIRHGQIRSYRRNCIEVLEKIRTCTMKSDLFLYSWIVFFRRHILIGKLKNYIKVFAWTFRGFESTHPVYNKEYTCMLCYTWWICEMIKTKRFWGETKRFPLVDILLTHVIDILWIIFMQNCLINSEMRQCLLTINLLRFAQGNTCHTVLSFRSLYGKIQDRLQ